MEREALIKSLNSLSDCSEETKLQFSQLFQGINLAKGQLLATPVSADRSIHFLYQGLLHQYQDVNAARPQAVNHYPTSKVQTLQFYLPNEFVGGINYTLDKATYLSCILPSTILSATCDQLKELCERRPDALSIQCYLQELWLQKLLDQLKLLRHQLAIDRYELAIKKFGKYQYLVPQHFLASYLAISRKHLGRIKSQRLHTKY